MLVVQAGTHVQTCKMGSSWVPVFFQLRTNALELCFCSLKPKGNHFFVGLQPGPK